MFNSGIFLEFFWLRHSGMCCNLENVKAGWYDLIFLISLNWNLTFLLTLELQEFHGLHPVASLLSYLAKAPLVNISFSIITPKNPPKSPFFNEGSTWHTSDQCLSQTEGNVRELHEGLYWPGSRKQHASGVQVKISVDLVCTTRLAC